MAILIPFLLTLSSLHAQSPIHLDSRRELFIDRLLIGQLNNATHVLHHPVDRGPVIFLNKPWEGQFSGYTTIIKDGPTYRLYYRGLPSAGRDGRNDETTCYAESTDGIHWSRPNLRLFNVQGTLDNNVILANNAPFSHNFAPFLDTNPSASPQQRFKAISGLATTGLVAWTSPDGIHWSKLREQPIFPPGPSRFDSQNLAFYSAQTKSYVAYYRTFKKIGNASYRWITRATSTDFINWSPSEDMTFGDAPPEHLYTNQTSPYFRAPHILISIAARFFPGRQVLDAEEARAIQVNPSYFKDISDAVLLSSRGGNAYDRTFQDAFIRPGPGLENWVSRTNYPAWNVVETGPAEMSLYVNKNYGQPTAQLVRYSLRIDGFASIHAPISGGELLTKPLTLTGSQLDLNFATSAGGSIRVEVQDLSGKPLPGFALSDSHELIGDSISRPARWASGTNTSAFSGKPVRLRFVLRDADLYSLQMR